MSVPLNTYDLNSREEIILQQIIKQYILTANPVGSRTISKQKEINLSAASIRNIMADLEEKGYIGHPHTSAGRVPTDIGYRYYVNSIMETERLTQSECEYIDSTFDIPIPTELDEAIKECSKILSKISQQLAIVSTPQIGSGKLQRLELVEINSNRIMVILSITSGLVKTIIIEINSVLSRNSLNQVSSLLNERLAGLTLREIRESFYDRFRDVSTDDPSLISLFIQSSDRLFSEHLEDSKIYIDGMRSILQYPEFGDPIRLRNIIELVENQNIFIQIFDKLREDEPVTIKIGSEIEDEKLIDCSLVASHYRVGPMVGTISIIGPRRMNYPRMIAIVKYLSDIISH